jgi:hypothetical protein
MANKQEETDIQSQLLLRELEEEHRREQYAKLWKAYGTYVIAGAAAIVVGVGGFKVWQTYAASRAAAAGAAYETALNTATGGPDEARKAFSELANSAPRGYATLARLQVAAAEAKAGKTAEAVRAFEELAGDSGADALLRDFARLQAAALRAGEADWTEMQNRLNPLVGDTNPWRFSARELWGVAALKAGRTDEARRSFEQLLGDRATPPSIGQRAQVMMSGIVAKELASATSSPPAPKKE